MKKEFLFYSRMGPSRFSNILEILENPTEVFAWMIIISSSSSSTTPGIPGIVSTVKPPPPPYLLCFIFSNVPIIVSVVQSKPNNCYLVLNREKSSFGRSQPTWRQSPESHPPGPSWQNFLPGSRGPSQTPWSRQHRPKSKSGYIQRHRRYI